MYRTLFLLAVVFATASASRQLRQDANTTTTPAAGNATGGGAGGNATGGGVVAALQAANNTGLANLSTLIAAFQAAGPLPGLDTTAPWTLLAPEDYAFDFAIPALGLTGPADLLAPAQRPLLIKILSNHIIPRAAVNSSSLTEGQNVTTFLGAASPPLIVHILEGNVTFEGPANNATVLVPDLQEGPEIIHVIDDVLLPAGLNLTEPGPATGNATGPAGATGGAEGANATTAGGPAGGANATTPTP